MLRPKALALPWNSSWMATGNPSPPPVTPFLLLNECIVPLIEQPIMLFATFRPPLKDVLVCSTWTIALSLKPSTGQWIPGHPDDSSSCQPWQCSWVTLCTRLDITTMLLSFQVPCQVDHLRHRLQQACLSLAALVRCLCIQDCHFWSQPERLCTDSQGPVSSV